MTTAEFHELILKAVKAELENARRLAASLKEERDNWRAYAEALSLQLDDAEAAARAAGGAK